MTPHRFLLAVNDSPLSRRELYPYISKECNDILMHFSQESTVWYESVAELIADLQAIIPTT